MRVRVIGSAHNPPPNHPAANPLGASARLSPPGPLGPTGCSRAPLLGRVRRAPSGASALSTRRSHASHRAICLPPPPHAGPPFRQFVRQIPVALPQRSIAPLFCAGWARAALQSPWRLSIAIATVWRRFACFPVRRVVKQRPDPRRICHHEAEGRPRHPAEGTGPCPERGGTAQHHPHPGQRHDRRARRPADPDRHRHGNRGGRGRSRQHHPQRRLHRAGRHAV